MVNEGIPNKDIAIYKGATPVAELTMPTSFESDQAFVQELLVKGDLTGSLTYKGEEVQVDSVNEIVGLEVGALGARGPIWRGVVLKKAS